MPRFAANLTMLFTELPFAERFVAAASHGFTGVEYLFPYDHAPDDIAAWQRAAGVETVLFNLPPGDWAAGERGLAALPGREADFRAALDTARPYLAALGTRQVHAMAGIPQPGSDPAAVRATYLANLRFAADVLAADGVTLLIEPISRRMMPGYALWSFADARAVIAEAGAPNLRLQADLFHMANEGDDIAALLSNAIADIAHIQIAGVPDRHEPDTGTLDHAPVFAQLDALGYTGWIGCEYHPRAGTAAGLGWLARLQSR